MTPQDRYAKNHTKCFTLRFMKNTEPELIAWLDAQPNKAGYIKRLMREDMARAGR